MITGWGVLPHPGEDDNGASEDPRDPGPIVGPKDEGPSDPMCMLGSVCNIPGWCMFVGGIGWACEWGVIEEEIWWPETKNIITVARVTRVAYYKYNCHHNLSINLSLIPLLP